MHAGKIYNDLDHFIILFEFPPFITDPVNELFQLVVDKKMDIKIYTAAENNSFTVIEGGKMIDNCDDAVEDIALSGKYLKENIYQTFICQLFQEMF